MQEKGLDYAAALEFYYKNKNYIDTRMYGYDRTATAREIAAQTGAGAKVDSAVIAAGSKDTATLAKERDSMEKAIEKLDSSMVGIMKNKNPSEYQQKLGEIYSRYPNVAPQGGGKPEIYTGATLK
jgi:hypothetical protein